MEAKPILQDAAAVSSPTLAERVRRVWALRQALKRMNTSADQADGYARDLGRANLALLDAIGGVLPDEIWRLAFHERPTDADLAEAIRVAEERDAAKRGEAN